MQGERDLTTLLHGMVPVLAEPIYVYCSFGDNRLPDGLRPVCQFRETEGLTAIVEKADADAFGVPCIFEARMITLAIHSDLAAVGFLAVVHSALADAGIPCNSVAAYYHDHLFVPVDRANDAMRLLYTLRTKLPASAA